jgi:hypothetical protein
VAEAELKEEQKRRKAAQVKERLTTLAHQRPRGITLHNKIVTGIQIRLGIQGRAELLFITKRGS